MPSKTGINSDDYYAVLGVDRNVSDAELAKAYKKLALKHHPDKNPDRKEQAEEDFKKISEAYDVLRCPEKRKEYDQYGKASSGMDSKGNPQESDSSFFFGSNGGRPQRSTMSREEADKIFENFFPGGSPFADMFNSGSGPFGFRMAGPGSGDSQGFGYPGFSSGGIFGGMGTEFPRTSTNRFRSATTSRARTAAGHRRGERARSRRAHSRPQSQSQKSLHHHVLAKGTAIVVQGLTQSPEHNGKNGHIVAWDASRGRYEVRMRIGDEKIWVGDDCIRLRPQNITQLCSVEVTGLTAKPELNGMDGVIVNYCKSKRRYMVHMDSSGSTVSLQPANCILSCDTCVLLDSLTDQAWNGQRARIIDIDRSVGRYIVECESGTQLKVKYDNVLC